MQLPHDQTTYTGWFFSGSDPKLISVEDGKISTIEVKV